MPRGRPKKNRTSEVAERDDDASIPDDANNSQVRKRGLPPKTSTSTKEPGGKNKSAEKAARKRRERDAQPEEGHGEDQEQGAGESSQPKKGRKRGRPSLGDENEETEGTAPKRRRSRPSLGEVTVSKVQNKTPKPTAEAQKKKSRASLTQDIPSSSRSREQAGESSPPSRSRPRQNDAAGSADTGARTTKPNPSAILKQLPHFVPKERELPISLIHSKWKPLEPPARAISADMLRLASVQVLQAGPSGTRRDLYRQAIDSVVKQVARQQAKKLPFPAASSAAQALARKSNKRRNAAGQQNDGRELELDRQRVEHDVREAEEALMPLAHSIKVLQAEVRRLEKVLDLERRQAEELERNAREAKGVWEKGLRKAHKLVPGERDWMNDGTKAGGLELEDGVVSSTPLFKDVPDGAVASLAKQVSSHIESMKSNVGQVKGLLPLIDESGAMLRTVLYKHLPQELYEEAVLGPRRPVRFGG